MNIDTGELMRFYPDALMPDGFMQVPDDFRDEAEKVLKGRDSAVIDLAADTPLAKWAGEQRKLRDGKAKTRRKMAKASRRKNRRTNP